MEHRHSQLQVAAGAVTLGGILGIATGALLYFFSDHRTEGPRLLALIVALSITISIVVASIAYNYPKLALATTNVFYFLASIGSAFR